MSVPFTNIPKNNSIDAAVYNIFPGTVTGWQTWFLYAVLGSIVLYGLFIATEPPNPFYQTIKSLTLAILPFAYIGWSIVTRPTLFLYYRTLTVGLASLIITIVAQSVGTTPSPGSWGEKWKNFLGNTFQALLHGSLFVIPYIATGLV